MGWNDIGYTSTDISKATTFLSSLAERGVKLTRYYTQPSCTPSRATIMTGKWAYRNGFQNYELQHGDAVGVPLSNQLLPSYLSDLGYATHGLGKWNIGHCNSKYLPHERGFDHFIGYLCPGHGYRDFNCGLSAGVRDMIEGFATTEDSGAVSYSWATGEQYQGTYDTLLYRDKAVVAVKKHSTFTSDKPFFLWMAHHGMHSEEDSEPEPPNDLLTQDNLEYIKVLEKRVSDTDGEDEDTKRFFKMRKITATVLMSVDNAVRALCEALEEEDMMQNSVIFVNSDNGGDVLYTKVFKSYFITPTDFFS